MVPDGESRQNIEVLVRLKDGYHVKEKTKLGGN
jgi:hypothetical protein